MPGSEMAKEQMDQGAKGPGSEWAKDRIGQGPIGRFAPGNELAREQKGCESRAHVKCGVRGAGKSVSLYCGENCGDAPRNLDARTHTEAHASRTGRIGFPEAVISTTAGN